MVFDKNLLILEIIFLAGIIVSFVVEGNVFLKILILITLFLFIIKDKEEYKYNLTKYLYTGYGFFAILIFMYLTEYILHIYYIVFVMCVVVLYFYLYKVLFNTTYGEVVSNTTKKTKVKILDSFYRYNKTFEIDSRKKLVKGNLVLIKLSSFPINKKPEKIIKVLKK